MPGTRRPHTLCSSVPGPTATRARWLGLGRPGPSASGVSSGRVDKGLRVLWRGLRFHCLDEQLAFTFLPISVIVDTKAAADVRCLHAFGVSARCRTAHQSVAIRVCTGRRIYLLSRCPRRVPCALAARRRRIAAPGAVHTFMSPPDQRVLRADSAAAAMQHRCQPGPVTSARHGATAAKGVIGMVGRRARRGRGVQAGPRRALAPPDGDGRGRQLSWPASRDSVGRECAVRRHSRPAVLDSVHFRDEVLEPRHHQIRRGIERGVDLLLNVLQAPVQPRKPRTSMLALSASTFASRRSTSDRSVASSASIRFASRSLVVTGLLRPQEAAVRRRVGDRFCARRACSRGLPPERSPRRTDTGFEATAKLDPMPHASGL